MHLEKKIISSISEQTEKSQIDLDSSYRPRLGEVNKTMIRIHESTAFKLINKYKIFKSI